MGKSYNISAENAAEIKEYRKGIKDKSLDRRLHAVQLRGEGMKNKDIAQKLDCDVRQVSWWVSLYHSGGLERLDPKVGGRRRENMTLEEEKEFIEQFKKKAEAGHIIEVSEIKKKYDEKIGKETKPTYIYKVLKRHGWRKIMPRGRHPKKASDEAISASKKLKPE